VLLGFILGNAVALLQSAFELLALAVDGDEVVIGGMGAAWCKDGLRGLGCA
jgi:hypothetical protein